jgi:signal transduction histidine kinase
VSRYPSLVRSFAGIFTAGALLAVAAAVAGLLLQRAQLGADDQAAVRRVQAELDARFAETTAVLRGRVTRLTGAVQAVRPPTRDTGDLRALFQRLAAELPAEAAGSGGLTLVDSRGAPVAWAGRVSDLPRERLPSARRLSVVLDARGPRLVLVSPVPDADRPQGPPLATIVAEEIIGEGAPGALSLADTFRLSTAVVDVTVRAVGTAAPASAYTFAIQSADGGPLVEADVSPTDLDAARQRWRARTRAAVSAVLAMTVLVCAAPLLELRRHARRPGRYAAATVALVTVLVLGRLLLRAALGPLTDAATAAPFDLLPDALLLTALVWLAIDTIERRRVSRPRAPLLRGRAAFVARTAGVLLAGVTAGVLLWQYERVMAGIASRTSHDLLRFSLHPFDHERLGTASALVLLHAAVVWGAAAVLRLPAVLWRTPRTPSLRAAAAASAVLGTAGVVLLANATDPGVPGGPLLVAAAAAGLAALALSRPRGATRRASQAARLGLLFAGLVLPALALYPSLDAFAVASKERLIEGTFAPDVANQREDLQARQLPLALEAIDAMTSLPQFVSTSSVEAAPATDRAFLVWSRTVLSEERTTSAVELYGATGALVSRFALNLPEYGTAEYRGGSCSDWELYEEVSPFGTLSTLRNVLRASRAICQNGRRVGGIVVRARLDYHALPFISTQSPYLQSLTSQEPTRPEAAFGSDVELVVYGWSRAPLYASGTAVWPLADSLFQQMTGSRAPIWTRVLRDGEAFRVYFFNDRGGIYALGYPVVTRFGHLINLAELVFLAGAIYAVALLGSTLFNTLTSQSPAGGRALLREVRSSFYRKLFIAFVASAVVPVVVLAVATSTYFANQFRADVEESAVKTATVAQRLIEDYIALQQGGARSLDQIDDEFMLLVRRAIDEDVNLFDGARLQATSERPLFASQLLPARTSAEVYRAIVLDRLPTAVVVERGVGEPGYLVAAAPVRAGGREGIVTVPQTLRQREIESQIDEIDRRVLSAAVLFVLLGSALGYWMAERIADPVNRLTRATRRIARGDLDARIATTSSDELRRLVEDFNQMASDLKQQRAERERTQRLEAWAEMARQVAHDIKNPLTPIQLSAEHVRRVNQDRGRPLSPVLDECVAAILSQVTLLRQISTEFSSFASAPVPRPEPTDMRALLEEVVEPYRTGLLARIAIDLSVAPGLPRVFIDRTLFGRALTNVIENALHAMPGTGSLAVRASLDPVAEGTRPMIRVDVTDTGIGMDAEALARIFEPYFSTKATGTGLGLTIAKRNVELLGGRVDVRSERGSGTTVTMVLPAVSDDLTI